MSAIRAFDILRAINDPNIFGLWFRDKDTWAVWFAFLASLFGLPMTEDQLALFRQHTGRQGPPETPANEAWLVVGRRGGKSLVMALCATYLGTFNDYRQYLSPGERATIAVIAADRKQARVIMRYIRALLTNIPLLKKTIQRETAEAFDLTNKVTIEVTTANQRSTRGYTFAAVLCDEIAFWRTDEYSANPDTEILDAIRPGMATIPNSLLICASSPYARRGALWDAYRKWYGPEASPGSPLVWRATTREMNPTIPQSLIDEALERDPASAAAEYLAQFRTDMEMLLTREAVRACVVPGCRELPPLSRRHRYFAFVDPSGGSSDSMALAIAHREKSTGTAEDDWTLVLDAIREVRPPFSPEAVVAEFAALARSYGLRTVTGDRYGGEWPREQFRNRGLTYEVADQTRSDLYLNLVPSINSGRVRLLDLPRLESQLIALERRTTRVGRDLVDHPPGGHDDVANAAAGALVGALDAARRAVTIFSIDMEGRVRVRDDAPRSRAWSRTPGISAL